MKLGHFLKVLQADLAGVRRPSRLSGSVLEREAPEMLRILVDGVS